MYMRTCVRTNIRKNICTCPSRSGMSICNHLHSRTRNSCVTSKMIKAHTGGARDRDRGQGLGRRHFLTMEDGEDSASGPPQHTGFVESSAERIYNPDRYPIHTL